MLSTSIVFSTQFTDQTAACGEKRSGNREIMLMALSAFLFVSLFDQGTEIRIRCRRSECIYCSMSNNFKVWYE